MALFDIKQPDQPGLLTLNNPPSGMNPQTQSSTPTSISPGTASNPAPQPAPSTAPTYNQFFKYSNSPTVYYHDPNQGITALPDANTFYSLGGAKDFSNVRVNNGPAPTNAPVYGRSQAAPVQSQPTYTGSNQQGLYHDPSAPVFTQAQQTQPASQFQANPPASSTPSSDLSNPVTNADIMKSVQDNLNNQDKLLSNLSNYAQVSQNELNQQAAVGQAQLGVGEANQRFQAASGQAAGLLNPDNQSIPLEFLQGQGREKQFMAQQGVISAQLQQQLAQTALAYTQGNRQFAFNSAKDIFDASRNNLASMLDIYTKTAPQNLSTNYNPTTGQVTAIMRNPLTGAQYTGDLGNIGAQKSFTSQQIVPDPMNPGHFYFFGTTSDGQVVQKEIGGGGSSLGGGASGGSPSGIGQVAIPGYSGATQANGQPWRTDRNFNPIAAAISTNSSGNEYTKALDQAGIPWAKGDAFADNPNMSSIKILGNPVEGARAILSNSNAIQNWYANHTGKSVLPQYGIKNNNDFAKAPTSVQNAVIDGIYKAESGSGILTHPQTSQASALPPLAQHYVDDVPGYQGAQFIDADRVPATQLDAVKFQSAGAAPVLTHDEVNAVKSLGITKQNLDNLKGIANQVLSSGLYGRTVGGLLNGIQNVLQTDPNGVGKFNQFRDTAIKTLQGLAGGTGSGLRINQSEIENQISTMPTIHDNLETAMAKISQIEQFMERSLKSYIPQYQSSPNSSANSDPLGILS